MRTKLIKYPVLKSFVGITLVVQCACAEPTKKVPLGGVSVMGKVRDSKQDSKGGVLKDDTEKARADAVAAQLEKMSPEDKKALKAHGMNVERPPAPLPSIPPKAVDEHANEPKNSAAPPKVDVRRFLDEALKPKKKR